MNWFLTYVTACFESNVVKYADHILINIFWFGTNQNNFLIICFIFICHLCMILICKVTSYGLSFCVFWELSMFLVAWKYCEAVVGVGTWVRSCLALSKYTSKRSPGCPMVFKFLYILMIFSMFNECQCYFYWVFNVIYLD